MEKEDNEKIFKLNDELGKKNFDKVKEICLNNGFQTLYSFLNLEKSEKKTYKTIEKEEEKEKINKIKIKLLCNWCSSNDLTFLWNKMSKGNFTWNNIVLVTNEEPDFWVIINAVSDNKEKYDPKRSILFRMEPKMKENPGIWKEWSNPKSSDFLKIFRHENEGSEQGDFNNCEWHISLTYNQLSNYTFSKRYDNVISTVLSSKYSNIGQVKRINFIKFLEKQTEVHVYGDNKWNYKNFMGSLPYHKKDNALLPYKYTFNCENHFIPNYFTEKLIDGILSECLVFYTGCLNVKKYIDERAFVYLELSNFEKDAQIVMYAIRDNWYEKRLPYIKNMKQKILNELQFFPRLENFFKKYNETIKSINDNVKKM